MTSLEPNEVEKRWREFRNAITVNIPTVNFHWDEALVMRTNRLKVKQLPSVQQHQEQCNILTK